MSFLSLAKGSLFFCFPHCHFGLLGLYDKVNIVLHLLTLIKVGKTESWPQRQCGGIERPGTQSGVINSGFGFGNDILDFSLI